MTLSFQETTEKLRDAILAENPGLWVCMCDVFPGSAIYEIEGAPCAAEGDVAMSPDSVAPVRVDQHYQRSYFIVDGIITLGEAVAVEKQVSYVPLRASVQLQAAVGDTGGFVWRCNVVTFGPDKQGSIWWDKTTLTAALTQFEGARVFALAEAQHQAQAHPFGKSVRDLVGVLRNVAATATGIDADLVILPAAKWLRDNLVGCQELELTGVIGLSVDIKGQGVTTTQGGKKYQSLSTVSDVTVDVVYNPAAGGQIMRTVAAVREEMNMDKSVTVVAAVAPGGESQELTAIKGELTTLKAALCAQLLSQELSLSKLPEAAQDDLRSRFAGQLFDAVTLQAAIKGSKELVDRLTASGIVTGTGDVRIITDQRDKHVLMLDDFFAGKQNSFKAAYQEITGDMSISGDMRNATRLTAAINTAGFDQLLGDAITRKMVSEYNMSGLDSWKKVVQSGPVFDFRTNRRVRIGGYGNLAAVAQSGAYAALTTPIDEESTYAATKRGGTETVTLEAIRNDDVMGLRRIPIKLGRSAARTLYQFVFDMIGTNGVVYDAAALAVAGHNNLGTTALAQATLLAGRLAMLKQTEIGSLEVLGIAPRYLLVPPDLEPTAWGLVVSPSAGVFVPTAAQQQNIQTWEIIVVKTWTDTNNWWLVADPNDIPTIEVGFLDGKDTPELFVQDMPNVGSMFSNDQLTYKIRHIYGGAVLDYRGFYGAIVP